MTDVTTLSAGKPPLVVFRERLDARKTEIKNALPSDISVEAFIRAATTSAQLNPEIQACTWQSVWDALIRACRAGLLPDGQESAIVPFKSKAQFIPMVQGVLRNARRSGQIKWIKADVVRQGEVFAHEVTHEGEIFRHVPGDDFNAPIVRAYAVATTKDGAFFSAVMSIAEINKHRAFSRAMREDSPWNIWPEAMSVKTAIHRLGKMLPSVRDAISEDETMRDMVPDLPTLANVRAIEASEMTPPSNLAAESPPAGGASGQGAAGMDTPGDPDTDPQERKA